MSKRKSTIFVATVLLFVNCGFSSAATINDGYYGGTPTKNGAFTSNKDIVGAAEHFDVSKVEATQIGDTINLKIYSRFLDDSRTTYSQVALGDLFISNTGWAPYGSSPYVDDTAAAGFGESWEYALVLDDHSYSATSGNAYLFDINDGNILQSNSYFGSGSLEYRKDQEVQFKPDDHNLFKATSTWSIDLGPDTDDTDDYLSLSFNLADLGMTTGQELGFHWTMTCANDVIEGAFTPVPEPATMLLFGTGLIGLAGFARRRNKK